MLNSADGGSALGTGHGIAPSSALPVACKIRGSAGSLTSAGL